MNKPDGFIKLLAFLIILSGLMAAFEAFSFKLLSVGGILTPLSLSSTTSEFLSLIIGIVNISVGIGILKLKRWALYGVAILLVLGIISLIFDILSTEADTLLYIFAGVVVLFRLFIYSYLWQKRALFT